MLKTKRGVAALLLSVSCTLSAGELRLNNGAVLPGELASISADKLVWKADKIGEVTVSKADITSLQTSHAIAVQEAPDEAARTDCIVRVESSLWSLDCASRVPNQVAFAQLHSMPPATSTNGKITTSLDIERGANPSETIEFDLAARWLRPTHRHNVEASVDYETSDGDTTEDEADASYQYDLLRSEGWFWFGRTRYYRDKFEALQEAYSVGVGIGREFTPLDDLRLSVQGGPMEIHYVYSDQGSGTEPGGAWRWSMDWQTPWRGIKAFHSGDLGWIFAIDDGYLFQSKSGVTFPLYEGLIGEVRLDYDRTGVNAFEGSKKDIEWVLGLGYKW
ncbi:MAG: DUF481 domain-containing protein [Haliea sp.]|nr:DUF481 domain-containing protein [Haliea sp.]